MSTSPSTLPTSFGTPIHSLASAAERAIQEKVREEISRLLGERQLVTLGPEDEDRLHALIRRQVSEYQREAAHTNALVLSDADATQRRIFHNLFGWGVLQPLMDDPEVEEIACNGPGRIHVFRHTEWEFVEDLRFEDEDELVELVKRRIAPSGRRLDEAQPMADVCLPDGSRLNVVLPPAAVGGSLVTIRKFVLRTQTLAGLLKLGAFPAEVVHFLECAVGARLNILISGSTGAGKTTLLNALGSAVPPSERVVTIEETAELALADHLPNCAALQGRGANQEGVGDISIRELVRNALRMRPDRIVVGEVRGEEALDMLQAMNTGHEGSLTTLHAAGARDALDRLVTLASWAPERPDEVTLGRTVANTIHLVLQLRRDPITYRRRLTQVFEVTGFEKDNGTITGHDLWALDSAGEKLQWTGVTPKSLERMRANGVTYSPPLLSNATGRER
jgi:pilus assembly protein CpaF